MGAFLSRPCSAATRTRPGAEELGDAPSPRRRSEAAWDAACAGESLRRPSLSACSAATRTPPGAAARIVRFMDRGGGGAGVAREVEQPFSAAGQRLCVLCMHPYELPHARGADDRLGCRGDLFCSAECQKREREMSCAKGLRDELRQLERGSDMAASRTACYYPFLWQIFPNISAPSLSQMARLRDHISELAHTDFLGRVQELKALRSSLPSRPRPRPSVT